jgi:N-acetylneuraminate synthase
MKIFVEVGLNHLGNSNLAIDIVKKCLKQNIDGITFQILPEPFYNNSKNYKTPLTINTYKKISSIIKKRKKLFGLAIMDVNTLEKFRDVKVDFFKILSLGFKDKKLIKKASNTKKKLFVSTGFSNTKSIFQLGKDFPQINFIHTSLDRRPEDANLRAIATLKKKIKNKISFGLHSKNHEVLLISVSFSPDSLFFYVKPDKRVYYPDDEHAVSLNELPNILRSIKITQQSLGNGIKIIKKTPKWIFR